MAKSHYSRTLRFSLRFLLIVVTVIAVFLGYRSKTISDRKRAVERLAGKRASVFYAWQQSHLYSVWIPDSFYDSDGTNHVGVFEQTKLATKNTPLGEPAMRTLDWIRGTHIPSPHTISLLYSELDQDMMEILRKLPDLKTLYISNFFVDDKIETLHKLQLQLPGVEVATSVAVFHETTK